MGFGIRDLRFAIYDLRFAICELQVFDFGVKRIVIFDAARCNAQMHFISGER